MWSRLYAESSMMVGVTDFLDEMQELATVGSGQYPRENVDKVTNITADEEIIHEESEDLLSAVLERPNMLLAYDRVMCNKGAAGVDGMKVEELSVYLKSHWSEIKEVLLNETYQPQPVRNVEIPKPGGRKRQLGIPTVLDRLIQLC